MGPCDGDGCGREMFRGDIFFINALGFLLCVDCWEKVPGVDASMHRAEHVTDVREMVWDGEFPA